MKRNSTPLTRTIRNNPIPIQLKLTYSVLPASVEKCQLIKDPQLIISNQTWENLSKEICKEPKLINCSAKTLKKRWLNGQAACAIYNEEVVSYISYVSSFSTNFKQSLAAILNLDYYSFPKCDVSQFVTGWTKPGWTNKGIYSFLNKELSLNSNHFEQVRTSYCLGLAASPVFKKMEWKIASWNSFPFVGSLGGWIENGEMFIVHENFKDSTTVRPYCGDDFPLSEYQSHDWDKYCHLWIQDLPEVLNLERKLNKLLKEDLKQWRAALKVAAAA